MTRLHGQSEAQRARMLDRLVQTHTAIAMSNFGLEDMLRTVVEEALDLTGADAAVVELPDGGDMVYRAIAAQPSRWPAAGAGKIRFRVCLATVEALVVAGGAATRTARSTGRHAGRWVRGRWWSSR